MAGMAEQAIDEFLAVLDSKAAVPGGGGASALVGAMAASLAGMVAHLTEGKKKYQEWWDEIPEWLARAEKLRLELTALMDADAEAFLPLSKAYGLPKDTEEEKAERERVMEEALLTAAMPPLHMMEKTMEVIELLKILEVKGSTLAASDVAVAAEFANAALRGAAMNIFINTKMMKNCEQADALNQKALLMIEVGGTEAREISKRIAGRFLA